MTVSIRRDSPTALRGLVLTSSDPRFPAGHPVPLAVQTLGGRTTVQVAGRPAHLDPRPSPAGQGTLSVTVDSSAHTGTEPQ